MSGLSMQFNPPPGWPPPPPGWVPPEGWVPDPSWPSAPAGWQFWVLRPPTAAEPAAGVFEDAAMSTQGRAERVSDDDRPDVPTPDPAATEMPADEPPVPDAAESQAPPGPPRRAASLAPLEETAIDSHDELERLRAERDGLREALTKAQEELARQAVLTEVGVYQFRHPLDNAEQYKEALKEVQGEISASVRAGEAISAAENFVYNNSLVHGRRMVEDFSKLMLRAYNAEAENCVRTVRAGSVPAAVARLNRAVETIARHGKFMDMRVTDHFHALRINEIELTGDYLVKVQEERELERARREELREQQRAEAELAAERKRLEKERSHYTAALEALRAQGKIDEVDDLEARLAALEEAIEFNDFRAANIRAGYVYVISNIGAFGPDVVKIGMTRRLEPMDRVRELGDASVPFPFDVHMLHFSEDAVSVENDLHKVFADRRLNLVNHRREYFRATPAEVREAIVQKIGNVLEFTEEPEAFQFRQSQTLAEGPVEPLPSG